MRPLLVILHRYAGLALAVFMVVVARTGSVLAFSTSLKRVIAPAPFAPKRAGTPLELPTLIECAGRLESRMQVFSVSVRDGDRALYALHMARIGGRPYQVINGLAGAVTALLSVTGV